MISVATPFSQSRGQTLSYQSGPAFYVLFRLFVTFCKYFTKFTYFSYDAWNAVDSAAKGKWLNARYAVWLHMNKDVGLRPSFWSRLVI